MIRLRLPKSLKKCAILFFMSCKYIFFNLLSRREFLSLFETIVKNPELLNVNLITWSNFILVQFMYKFLVKTHHI